MKPKAWTESELKSLRTDISHRRLGEMLERTPASVRMKRVYLGIEANTRRLEQRELAAPTAKHTTHKKDQAVVDNSYWKSQYQSLHKQYQKALKNASVTERLVEDIKELAPTSYESAPRIHLPSSKIKNTPESAVLLFSDTHIGKVTLPAQTLGFAEYNFALFLARLKHLEESVVSIITGHSTAPLEELVIAMMGDMLDGALNHGNEMSQHNTIFSQYYAGAHAIAQFFRNLARHVPKIRVRTVVGNHTRYGTQKKMPTENRYSNFDMFMYSLVQALTKDITNIEWELNQQPFSVFTVQGWTFFQSHGDNLRGGDKAFGIPVHSMARQLNSMTQLFYKFDAVVPEFFILGHFHRPIQLPTGLGEFIVNGAFPGLDNYALDGGFNPVDPTQTFFRVHPKFGKIAEYKIQLKYAIAGKPTYDLPGNFTCV